MGGKAASIDTISAQLTGVALEPILNAP